MCAAFRLCTHNKNPGGALKFQQPLQSDEEPVLDFPPIISPFIANVPLLLYPQEETQVRMQSEVDLTPPTKTLGYLSLWLCP